MVKRIIWSFQAEQELADILKYWLKRNKSQTYSLKLINLFEEATELLSKFPEIGQPTDIPNVKSKLVRDYLIFYRIDNDILYIISVWDPRQDPDKMDIK